MLPDHTPSINAILEHTGLVAYLKKADGRYLYVNREFERVSGIKSRDIIGRCDHEVFPAPLADLFVSQDRRVRRTRKPIEFEETTPLPKGTLSWMTTKFPLFDGSGKVAMVGGVCTNVTKQKLAEKALTQSEARFRSIVENIGDALFTHDFKGKVLDVNENACKLYGYTRAELIGNNLRRLAMPENINLVEQRLQRLHKDGMVRFENVTKHKNGTRFSTDVHSRVVSREGGGIVHGLVRDISSRVKVEEALREKSRFLEDSQRIARIGSYSYDLRTGLWKSSPILDTIFGIASAHRRDLAGWEELIHPEERKAISEYLQVHVLKEQRAFDRQYRILRPSDGQIRWVHGYGELLCDAKGRPIQLTGVIQDITERRLLEMKILEISDRERRTIGHDLHDDLGQQISGIALLGRALQKRLRTQASPESDPMSDLLRHLDRALEHLRNISRGLAAVPTGPEGLQESLHLLAANIRATSEVSCRTQLDRHALVRDSQIANHLHRIAQEAVQNALRHGRPRNISLGLSKDAHGLTLAVKDDGIGMSKRARNAGGMGLDIMRYRAGIIGGTFSISSRRGKGTTVTCRVAR